MVASFVTKKKITVFEPRVVYDCAVGGFDLNGSARELGQSCACSRLSQGATVGVTGFDRTGPLDSVSTTPHDPLSALVTYCH